MSLFSKKHYVWLASHQRDELRLTRASIERWWVEQATKRLATMLADDNPAFDPNLFLRNCGLDAALSPMETSDADADV